jgi:hypothetical protein
MERIVRGRSATLYKTFYADGVATDPTGSPTVTVTRLSTGATVTTGAVTDEAAAGTWSVTIPATSNLLLDTLTVDWAATVNGVSQEYLDTVEVAGGTYFTVAEARALSPLSNTTTYTTAAIVDMRTTVEQAIEEHYGTALVPRYRLETLSGAGDVLLRLTGPVTAIRSVTVNGTALGVSDLAALYTSNGYLSGYTWTAGVGNIVVGYEYGIAEPPGRVKLGALRLARQWLVNGPIDDRALGAASPDGNFSFGLATPGRNGSIFGLPDLDAAIQSSPYRVMVA